MKVNWLKSYWISISRKTSLMWWLKRVRSESCRSETTQVVVLAAVNVDDKLRRVQWPIRCVDEQTKRGVIRSARVMWCRFLPIRCFWEMTEFRGKISVEWLLQRFGYSWMEGWHIARNSNTSLFFGYLEFFRTMGFILTSLIESVCWLLSMTSKSLQQLQKRKSS